MLLQQSQLSLKSKKNIKSLSFNKFTPLLITFPIIKAKKWEKMQQSGKKCIIFAV